MSRPRSNSSIRRRDDDGNWQTRPASPPPAALDPATFGMTPDQRKIAELEARIAALEQQVAELRERP